jgi:hypothetical protein
MSSSSLALAGLTEEEIEQPFELHDSPYFHVEYTEKGDDLVYHFWPPGDSAKFGEDFDRHLENAFKAVLPSDQEVHGDYINLEEATVQHMHGVGAVPRKDAKKEIVIPRETYYVRVVGGLKNPLADVFLKGRVFRQLDSEIQENR